MSFQEILASSGGVIFILMTLIQLAPIKVNPWSKIAKAIGKALNGDVMTKLNEMQGRLDEHIRIDDERNADMHRVQILRFNRELLQDNIPHTQEDFIEALSEIDFYEHYCKEHPEYENNRAVLAIENIREVYKERLKLHDFLQESSAARREG